MDARCSSTLMIVQQVGQKRVDVLFQATLADAQSRSECVHLCVAGPRVRTQERLNTLSNRGFLLVLSLLAWVELLWALKQLKR